MQVLPLLFAVFAYGVLLQALWALPATDSGSTSDHWIVTNDVPQMTIQALLQTRDGYAWMTTSTGLVRFDGVRFRVFSKSSTPGLMTDHYTPALFEDRSGNLWAGTSRNGVVRYRDGRFRTFGTKDGLADGTVLRIDEDQAGRIWLYSRTGVAQWNGREIQKISLESGSGSSASLFPVPIELGADARFYGLWRKGKYGWERFAWGQWGCFPLPNVNKNNRRPLFASLQISSIFEDRQRRVWYKLMSDKRTYYCVEHGKLRVAAHLSPSLATHFVTFQDEKQRLWASDHAGNFGLLQGGQFRAVPGISTSKIFRVLAIADGTYLVGTQDHGLYRVHSAVITNLRHPAGLESAAAIVAGNQGTIWIGGLGIAKLEHGKFSLLRPETSLKNSPDVITALYADAQGLWLGTSRGLLLYRNGKFSWATPSKARSEMDISSIISDGHDGGLLIGTRNGLFRFGLGASTRVTMPRSTGSSEVTILKKDEKGGLWMGTGTGLVHFGASHDLASCNRREWAIGAVRAIEVDADGIVWAGTEENGLFRYENRRLTHYTVAHGLPHPGVHKMLTDNRGSLWISGENNLYRLRLSDLRDFALGRQAHITPIRFGPEDGVGIKDFVIEGQPGAMRSSDGRLWFGGAGVVSIVDPLSVPMSLAAPTPRLEDCRLDTHEQSCGQTLTVSPGVSQVEVRYTAFDWSNPNQIHFRYRLRNLDSEWVEAGTRRVAYYSHLPPGSYEFEIRAANSNGIWTEKATSFAVVVLPRFYRSWWFVTTWATTLSALLSWGWRRRLMQLRQAHHVQRAFSRRLIDLQEAERKRIAAELHDSLGQRLALINNLALLAGQDLGESQAAGRVQTISDQASQAIAEVKEISYHLRPFRLDRLGLTKTIAWIVRSTAEASQIDIEADLELVDGLLPKDSEINLFRIVQESLGNIVKHSGAGKAAVTVRVTESKLSVMIFDDGCGFVAREDTASGVGGFGLIGISERAQLIGGTARIESRPGEGTRVYVEILLPRSPRDF